MSSLGLAANVTVPELILLPSSATNTSNQTALANPPPLYTTYGSAAPISLAPCTSNASLSGSTVTCAATAVSAKCAGSIPIGGCQVLGHLAPLTPSNHQKPILCSSVGQVMGIYIYISKPPAGVGELVTLDPPYGDQLSWSPRPPSPPHPLS